MSIVGVADFKDNKSPIWDDVEKVVINGKLEDSFFITKKMTCLLYDLMVHKNLWVDL